MDWAMGEAAVLRHGFDPRSVAAPTAALSADYVARLRDLRRSESHAADIERRLTQLALAVPDLAAAGATDAIERWLRALALGPPSLAPATRNKILVQVGGLCRWLARRGKLRADPTAALDQVAVPHPLPAVFTLAELRTLLFALDDPYHRLFAVMAYTGMRVQAHACRHTFAGLMAADGRQWHARPPASGLHGARHHHHRHDLHPPGNPL